MKKILVVFGTRPEAIKMAPLVNELLKFPSSFIVKICVTAQHREMLDQVLDLFSIVPDHDLNLMQKGQDLYDLTSRVILGLRDVFNEEKPDLVLVHGDTTTSVAAALASFYQKIPVGHVEAGLRTYNIYSPWPEEINRQLTSRISTYNFAPTETSKNNLLNESINEDTILVTGNTVIDSLHLVLNKIQGNQSLMDNLMKTFEYNGVSISNIENWKSKERKLVLITGHRRENFGEGFQNICKSIKKLAETFDDVDFVYPMHLNPNVRKPIQEIFKNVIHQNVYLIEPLEYLSFVYLMNICHLVLTDSGGIQEEAPGLGKPVLVMRNTTERPEGIVAGTVKLVGTDERIIIEEVSKLILSNKEYEKMSKANNPYGNGQASEKIAAFLIKSLK